MNIRAQTAIAFILTCLLCAGFGFPSGSPKARAEMESLSSGITQESLTGIARIDSPNYRDFFALSREGAVIPGLQQDLVPQGLAYDAQRDWLVVSYYRENGSSMLAAVDRASGKLVKAVQLYKDPNTPYTGHAGGLAISREHLWVTSEKMAYAIPLDALAEAADGGKVVFADTIRTETNASFTAYADGILWVGEFARFDYKTDAAHHMLNRDNNEHSAWVAGYRLNADDTIDKSRIYPVTKAAIPDFILSVTDEIQGMAVERDRFVLSQSYGRTVESSLLTYRQPLSDPPHAFTDKFGEPVPIWFLDGHNRVNTIVMPPMSEGLAVQGNALHVLFESGASAYRDGFYPIDRLYALETDALFAFTPTVPGAPQGEPPLLITEISAASPGEGEPYEYIELYNNSNRAIDLAGYKIYYYYDPTSPRWWGTKVTKWTLMKASDVSPGATDPTDTVVKPHQTKIVWLKKPGYEGNTVADFNAAYGSRVKADEFVYIKLVPGQGLSDTAQRFVAVVAPRGDEIEDRISYATYNGSSAQPTSAACSKDGSHPCDFAVGQSINYFYPPAGLDSEQREMERKDPDSLRQTPTPGKLVPGQHRSIGQGHAPH